MVEKKSVLPTAIVTTFGVGFLYILLRNRTKIFRQIKSIFDFRNPLRTRTIEEIVNVDECEQIVKTLKKHCSEYRVLGFDCEWVAVGGSRRPVALLQLASHRGLCALIRLCYLGRIPRELRELLEDETIVKVGVAPQDDARNLSRDYGVGIASTFDLRYLAAQVGQKPEGLAKLSKSILKIELDKDWRIRCSDWEAKVLSERQKVYAANDAFVAIELFKNLSGKIKKNFWQSKHDVLEETLSTCEPFIDVNFKDGISLNSAQTQKSLGIIRRKIIANPKKDISRNMSTRSKCLYDNCLMEAPDGEILCTCDKKKAQWYIDQNLGELVNSDPFTVRLNFEPAGRAVGDVGKYYTLAKENHCVVCGREDSYIRKNVVPREYRKYFPVVMKSHTSHDILLLCPRCHQLSNISDIKIREKLSKMCNAPMAGEDGGTKVKENPKLRQVRSAARALLNNSEKIPDERKEMLMKTILDSYPVDTEFTNDLLVKAASVDIMENIDNYCMHGLKVVNDFIEKYGGLIELEKIWREHFVKTMRPKYLPELWSVTHNAHRLEIRANEGRIQENDMVLAGIKLENGNNCEDNNTFHNGEVS